MSRLPPPDPFGVHHPSDEDEVAALVRHARASRQRLRVRGSMHSERGAIDEGCELPVALDRLDRIVFDEARRRVTVGAGCRFGGDPRDPLGAAHPDRGLCEALDRRGWALPCLGGVAHQTVVGFLATGSAGGALDRGLAQQVVSMRLIDGRGELRVLDRDADPDEFAAVGASLGLLGVITAVTLQCVEAFDVVGQERPLPVSALDDPAALFRLATYTRAIWFPQRGVDRAALWQADPRPPIDLGDPAASRSKPYAPFPKTLGSQRVTQAAAAAAMSALDRWPETLAPRARTTLQGSFVPPLHAPPVPFADRWHRALPMDDAVDERLLPVRFAEVWIDLERGPEAIRRLRRAYRERGRDATGNFVCEIYPGPQSPFWLAPGCWRRSLRLNFFWYERNRGDARAFFGPLLRLFDGLGPRLHWGKVLHDDPRETARMVRASYLRFGEFAALRETLDPDGVFLTPYWRAHLGLPARSSERATAAPPRARPAAPSRGAAPGHPEAPRLRWPLVFRLRPATEEYATRARHVFEERAVVDAPAEEVLRTYVESVEGRAWIPGFVGAFHLNGDDVRYGAVWDDHFAWGRLRVRTLVYEPGRRWIASVDAASLPLSEEMLQRVDVSERPEGGTELWIRVHYDPPPAIRPFHPLVRPLFSRLFFQPMARGLERHFGRPARHDGV